MPGKTRASNGSRGSTRGGRPQSAKALKPNPFLALVETVRKEVDARLAGLLDAKLDAAAEQDVEVLEMVRAFRETLEQSKKYKTDMRHGAYVVAVGRVSEATKLRGVYP